MAKKIKITARDFLIPDAELKVTKVTFTKDELKKIRTRPFKKKFDRTQLTKVVTR